MSSLKAIVLAGVVAGTLALAACGQSQSDPGTPAGQIQRGGQQMAQGARQIATGVTAMAADSAVTAHVKARLAANQGLASFSIHVDTRKGVVTLTGTVNSKSAKKLAGKVASETDGVRVVVNKLGVNG